MPLPSPNELLDQAAFFTMLADPSRLAILYLLLEKPEMKVLEIQEALGFSQTKVSRHLDWLKRSGLVGYRKDLTSSYYFILPEVKEKIKNHLQ
jgi:ArsR family transcriptional regulator